MLQFQRLPGGNELDGSQRHFEAIVAEIPLGPNPPLLTIDMVTDLSCPLAYLGLKRLRAALASLGLSVDPAPNPAVRLRFHPVFINPNLDPDGESMENYMRRRRNISLEEYNDDNYPLNAAALALNYSYDKGRRVINPKRAHLAVEAFGAEGPLHVQAFSALAERYFEGGEDISDVQVLARALEPLESGGGELWLRRKMDRVEGHVMRTHRALEPLIDGVPHFLLREAVSGTGIELDGPQEVDAFAHALRAVLEAREEQPFGDGYGLLQQPPGKVLPAFGGLPTRVSSVDRLAGASIMGNNLREWGGPDEWPYEPSDFEREDEMDDSIQYEQPNFVSHVDSSALQALTQTYAAFFASAQTDAASPLALLDTGSSWQSHYPPLPRTARVAVQGLNAAELAANVAAAETAVVNLNTNPHLPYANVRAEGFEPAPNQYHCAHCHGLPRHAHTRGTVCSCRTLLISSLTWRALAT